MMDYSLPMKTANSNKTSIPISLRHISEPFISTKLNLETNWQIDNPKAHSSRLVDQEGVDHLIQEFAAGNCRRLDPDNHMKATTTRENAMPSSKPWHASVC